MPSIDLHQIFLESASEVLETMFFTGVMEETAEPQTVGVLSAEVKFHGQPSGRFGVQISENTARSIAATFLGLDEGDVTSVQTGDVLCELANMICGSVLSRIEAGARFELLHPELDAHNADWRQMKHAVGCTFGLEQGTISLWVALEDAAISSTELISSVV